MKRNPGKTIWFTGLSGSGKSTLSQEVKSILERRNINVVLLDGDILRSGLNRDLGFSAEDRAENIRRAGETARILSNAGHTVLAAFITPLETLRRAVRNLFDPGSYAEIYLECSLGVCEDRDPKGLYKKARQGHIPHFTGISSPFEIPRFPDLMVSTDKISPEHSVDLIMHFLEKRFPEFRAPHTRSATTLSRKRVAVIGLDGVPASLLFGKFKDRLPTFRMLMENGLWGPLKSTDPPITIPAWTCMTSGKDPGELGLYGFRNRAAYDYSPLTTADSTAINTKRIWDKIEERGGKSLLIGVPQTYPARKHNGITVSGFPASRTGERFTYPPELSAELNSLAGGEYLEDITEFRNKPLSELKIQLQQMVERRFSLARRLLVSKPWDFFMMVEIAPDRLHHMFWRFFDPDHPKHLPGSPFENVIPQFYEDLDARLNFLFSVMDDNTTVIIVSDHGAMPCTGGFCLNEWLISNGYLFLKQPMNVVKRLESEMIDWEKTTIWSEGGYYGRIFLNVKGREPNGQIEQANYEGFRDELVKRLSKIEDGQGNCAINQVLKPDEIYSGLSNIPPDLMIYFDGLKRRAVSTVGSGRIFVEGDGYSLDDCNHDPMGIFLCVDLADMRSGRKSSKKINGLSYKDVSAMILRLYEGRDPLETGPEYQTCGAECFEQAFSSTVSQCMPDNVAAMSDSFQQTGFSSEEQEIVKKRLEELGYI